MKLRFFRTILVFFAIAGPSTYGISPVVNTLVKLEEFSRDTRLSSHQQSIINRRLDDMERKGLEWMENAQKYPAEPIWRKMGVQCLAAVRALRAATILQDDMSNWLSGPAAGTVPMAAYNLGTYYLNIPRVAMLLGELSPTACESYLFHEFIHSKQDVEKLTPSRGEPAAYTAQYIFLLLSNAPMAEVQETVSQLQSQGVIRASNPSELAFLNQKLGLEVVLMRRSTLALTPEKCVLAPQGKCTFTLTASGLPDNSVTWSSTPASSSVTQNGEFTAPREPGMYWVTVAFELLPGKTANAVITVDRDIQPENRGNLPKIPDAKTIAEIDRVNTWRQQCLDQLNPDNDPVRAANRDAALAAANAIHANGERFVCRNCRVEVAHWWTNPNQWQCPRCELCTFITDQRRPDGQTYGDFAQARIRLLQEQRQKVNTDADALIAQLRNPR